jgi:hypothetical protein
MSCGDIQSMKGVSFFLLTLKVQHNVCLRFVLMLFSHLIFCIPDDHFQDVPKIRELTWSHINVTLSISFCHQIILGVLAALSLLLPALPDLSRQTDILVDYTDGSAGRLSWEQYQTHCHQPAWEQSSVASVQSRCSHLVGTPVGWDGYVTDIRIRSISNTLETIFCRCVRMSSFCGYQL